MSDTSQPTSTSTTSGESSGEAESQELPPADDVLGNFVYELNGNLQRHANK